MKMKTHLLAFLPAALVLLGCAPDRPVRTTNEPAAGTGLAAAQASPAVEGALREPPPAPDCENDRIGLVQRLHATGDTRQAGCSTDDDCEIVSPGVACQATCPIAILKSRHEDWDRERGQLAEALCPRISALCHLSHECEEPAGAACRRGACVVVDSRIGT
jgi:hypothetical protein